MSAHEPNENSVTCRGRVVGTRITIGLGNREDDLRRDRGCRYRRRRRLDAGRRGVGTGAISSIEAKSRCGRGAAWNCSRDIRLREPDIDVCRFVRRRFSFGWHRALLVRHRRSSGINRWLHDQAERRGGCERLNLARSEYGFTRQRDRTDRVCEVSHG